MPTSLPTYLILLTDAMPAAAAALYAAIAVATAKAHTRNNFHNRRTTTPNQLHSHTHTQVTSPPPNTLMHKDAPPSPTAPSRYAGAAASSESRMG